LEISAAESACLTAWAAFPTANRDSPVIVGENPAKACRMSSVPPVSSSSHPRPWEDKNPWIAGVLAFLIPGAGHLYQGRTVKGIIYCVSILGLFFWGQKMGEGMVVYGDVTLSPTSHNWVWADSHCQRHFKTNEPKKHQTIPSGG
jgi:hypothetical protein